MLNSIASWSQNMIQLAWLRVPLAFRGISSFSLSLATTDHYSIYRLSPNCTQHHMLFANVLTIHRHSHLNPDYVLNKKWWKYKLCLIKCLTEVLNSFGSQNVKNYKRNLDRTVKKTDFTGHIVYVYLARYPYVQKSRGRVKFLSFKIKVYFLKCVLFCDWHLMRL